MPLNLSFPTILTYKDQSNNFTDVPLNGLTTLTNEDIVNNTPSGEGWVLDSITLGSNITTIYNSCCCGITTLRYCDFSRATNLTNIGLLSFTDCSGLESVDLSGINLTTLGTYAFSGCTSLQYVNLSDCVDISNSALENSPNIFSGCTNLTTVMLPNTLEIIPPYTFQGCTSLTSINFPTSLKYIYGYAFSGCSSLPNANLSGTGLLEFGGYAFANCTNLQSVSIPSSVSFFGEYLFSGCSDLSGTIDLSSNSIVNSGLEQGVFKDCSSLISVILPNNLANMPYQLFSGCTNLKNVVIPSGCTDWSAGSNFSGCSNLTSITLPQISSIGQEAFYNCAKLTNINFPSSLSMMGIDTGAFANCTSLSIVDLSGTLITYTGNSCFTGCSNLTTVILPQTMSSISDYSFYNCSKLININLSESINSIGQYAFANSGLTTITIPSIDSISEGCFTNCVGLTTVNFTDTSTITTYSVYIFDNIGANPTITFYNTDVQNPTNFITALTSNSNYLTYNFVYTLLTISDPQSGSGSSGSSGASGATGPFIPSGGTKGSSGGIISNVCFPAGTKILTDQGLINIEQLDRYTNTIRGFKILNITNTILSDDYVILIKKNALYKNVPNVDTIISKNHKIFYKGGMYKADDLSLCVDGMVKIKYSGYTMYNVILEKYENMIVNNMIAESLDHSNPIINFYTNPIRKY